jgi:carbamoylphosphate synthase large subunit
VNAALRTVAKLAVGFLPDEAKNAITRESAARFGPALDYVAKKIRRFASAGSLWGWISKANCW